VKGNLQNNDLNSFMTSAYWSGRLMHSQINYKVLNRSMVFITGHNLSVESDMAGRLLQTKLVMEEADVRAKKIRRVIDDKWLAKPAVRSEILSALWSLIVHWDKDGRPKGKTVMGGFEDSAIPWWYRGQRWRSGIMSRPTGRMIQTQSSTT